MRKQSQRSQGKFFSRILQPNPSTESPSNVSPACIYRKTESGISLVSICHIGRRFGKNIYKQNNNNSTIGFRDKQMLF